MADEDPILPGRACGSCTLCCKLLRIEALEKPAGEWCAHCAVGQGCTVYDTRPEACRGFHCGYLTLPMVDAKWFPAKSRMIVYPAPDGRRITVLVDQARPNAWREAPFHAELKAWARHGAGRGIDVVVLAGGRAFAIGDEDVDLGPAEA
jgi:hypothetical protein